MVVDHSVIGRVTEVTEETHPSPTLIYERFEEPGQRNRSRPSKKLDVLESGV